MFVCACWGLLRLVLGFVVMIRLTDGLVVLFFVFVWWFVFCFVLGIFDVLGCVLPCVFGLMLWLLVGVLCLGLYRFWFGVYGVFLVGVWFCFCLVCFSLMGLGLVACHLVSWCYCVLLLYWLVVGG